MTAVHPDPTIVEAIPNVLSSGRDPLAATHGCTGTQMSFGGGEPSETTDHRPFDTHGEGVDGPDSPPAEPNMRSTSKLRPARLGNALLLIYADALDDIERTRIATENRIRSLVQVKGLEDSPESRRLGAVAEGLRQMEHQVELDLKRAMRAHPLGPWVKAQRGIGDKQAARLLAAIGDPYIDHRTDSPRTVSQLSALCGYHVLPSGLAARRRKGQKANWNSTAKMRTYLIAKSCMKAGGPWRDIYDKRRANTAGRLHVADCPPCHAKAGEPWKPGHRHVDALRVTAKEILKALWIESRRLHALNSTAADPGRPRGSAA